MKDFIGGLGFIENINQFHLHDLFKNTGGTLISPNRLAAQYEESTGITPGAVSQPVGLSLDTRFNLIRGSELVTNGTFESNVDGWTPSAGETIAAVNGELEADNGPNTIAGAYQVITVEAGAWYECTANIRKGTADDVRIRAVDGMGSAGTILAETAAVTASTPTAVRIIFQADTTSASIYLRVNGLGDTGYFGNISVRPLPGHHAYQSTSASRPLLAVGPRGGVRNKLPSTDTYSTLFTNGAADWTKDGNENIYNFASGTQTSYGTFTVTAATEYTFAQDVALGTAGKAGYAIYDASNAAFIVAGTAYPGVSSEFSRKAVTFTTPVGCTSIRIYPVRYLDAGSLGTVRHKSPQLELGDTATPYQQVISSTEVHEAGVPDVYYLKHDQVDDALNVTFPDLGTDATLAYVTFEAVTILTGQTISGETELPTADWIELLAIGRPLTDSETANLTRTWEALAGI